MNQMTALATEPNTGVVWWSGAADKKHFAIGLAAVPAPPPGGSR